MTDPYVSTVTRASKVSGIGRQEFMRLLAEDAGFRNAVMINIPSARGRISLPRLARFLHGECWREVLAQWIVVPSPEGSTPAGSLKEPAGIL